MFKEDEIRPIVDEVLSVSKHLKISSGLNFGTNHLHLERELSGESDTKSWNSSAESFDLSETINMSWLDEDYNYTLACLDDDIFKLDNYHQNQCLPSLDDISLPSFYTSSINSNFKLDSKDKDDLPHLCTDSGYLNSIYEFNNESTDKQPDTQESQLGEELSKSNYYTESNRLNQHESTYLTLLPNAQQSVSNCTQIDTRSMNPQVNQISSMSNEINEISQLNSINELNQQMNHHNEQDNSLNQMNQQINQTIDSRNTQQINQQTTLQNGQQITSSTSPQHSKFQYQTQYMANNNGHPTSLPSVASLQNNLKSRENLNNNLNTNLNNTNSTINTNVNLNNSSNFVVTNLQSNLLGDHLSSARVSNRQLEPNNTTNTIKMNINCYYQTEQLHHTQLTYHHVQSNHRLISSGKTNSFSSTIDPTSSPSSISSSSNSSNSSPLPSLCSPALSPDNSTPCLVTNKPKKLGRANGKHGKHGSIQLWQFLKELLNQPHLYENCIKWINRKEGEFRIVNSVLVANLWGKRKNRPKMNYDKLSRSIRQYYKKNIMIKTTKSQRLVYKFVGDYMK